MFVCFSTRSVDRGGWDGHTATAVTRSSKRGALVSCLRKSLVLRPSRGYAARHAEKTPSQALVADGRRTPHAGAVDAPADLGATTGAAVADSTGLRGRAPQSSRGQTAPRVEQQRLQMARAVSGPASARPDGRATTRGAAQSDRRSDRRRDHPDARRPAGAHDAMDDAEHGRRGRTLEGYDRAHLADVWVAIASPRYIQTVGGPAVCRESA